MRYIYSVCLMMGAMGLPVAAATTPNYGPSCGKGVKGVPMASTDSASPATAPAPVRAVPTMTPNYGASCGKGVKGMPMASTNDASPAPVTATPSTPAPVKQQPTDDASRTQSFGWSDTRFTHPQTPGVPYDYYTSESTTSVAPNGRLARVTAYWPAEGDYYTRHGVAATGVRLHDGHCAVDPNIIPYGSVVDIAGVGKFLAVDTGTAVIARTAAREGGHTRAERNAIVVDLFFQSRREGEAFASSVAKWAAISWWTPNSTATQAKQARSLFAEEDWQKIQNKQL